MLKTALYYGAPAGAAIILTVIAVLAFQGDISSSYSEMFGFLVMIAGLSVIYTAIKRERETPAHAGTMRFTKATLLGITITAIAGLVYAGIWELYLVLTQYAFIEDYPSQQLARIAATGDAALLAAKKAEYAQFTALYRNPLIRFPITFLELFPVGLVITLISAGILRTAKSVSSECLAHHSNSSLKGN